MNNIKQEEHITDIDKTVLELLRKTVKDPPLNFSVNTTYKFASAQDALKTKKLIQLAAAAFAFASMTVWALLLNFNNAATIVWDGFQTTTVLIRSIFKLWTLIPITCGLSIAALTVVMWFSAGLLTKVNSERIFVK